MKKLLLLVLSAFCFGACSVDNEELDLAEGKIIEIDAVYEIDGGCEITTFDFDTGGKIEVRNDRDFIYVKFEATGDNVLTQVSLHIAEDFYGFPIAGKGNIKQDQMEFQESFEPALKEYMFQFPLSAYPETFLVAAHATFDLNGTQTSGWAGDEAVKQGNWKYFSYTVQDMPVNAGGDKTGEISLSEVEAIESWDEARKLFTSMLDPGVPEGQDVGSFEPSIWELINRFNDPELGGLGEYTTIYTIGEGVCTDSVVLTLIVVPDNN